MARYFAFALADSVFNGDCIITRRVLSVEEVKERIAQGVDSCLNPSHKASIEAMKSRFGIDVAIPEKPPRVSLSPGDSVIVRGCSRITAVHRSSRLYQRRNR